MNYQDRTKDEIIIELQKLLQQNNSLKESYQKEITSRKKTENAFHEGDAKMKSIFRAAPTGIGVIVNRNIRFVNQRFVEMLGYSEEELIGRSSRMVYLNDEEFERVGKYKYEQIEKYGTGTIETQLVRKDGGLIDVLLSSTPIDLNDPSKGITFTATDITETKQSEAKIKESAANLESLIENRKDSIWSVDQNYNYVIFNSFFAENYLAAYNVELKKGMNAVELHSAELKQFWKLKYASVLAGENIVFEFSENWENEKHYFEVSLNPIITDGIITGVAALSVEITERKKIQEELSDSERKFRLIADHTNDWEYWVNPEGKYLYLSQACERITGFGRDEFHKKPDLLFSIVHPDFAEKVKKHYRQQDDKHEATFNFTFPIINADGNVRWLEHNCSPVFDENGDFAGRRGNNRDITDRKKVYEELLVAKERIEKSEKKFRELFEKSGDAILILDNGNFMDCNKKTVEMIGYDHKNDFLNVHPHKLSPEFQPDGSESSAKANQMIEIALKLGSHRFEWCHLKRNGETFPVEVLLTTIINNPDNKTLHVVWRDISERKQAEEKHLRSEERYRMLFDYSPDPIMVHDGTKILDVNPATLEAVGLKDKQDLIGKDPFSMIHPDDRKKSVQRLEELVKYKKALETAEFRFVTPQNEIRTVLATPVPIIFDEKQAYMINYHDITERKKADVELQKSEKRFKRLFESLGDAVYVTKIGGENKGQILEVNLAAVKQSGYSRTELLKMNIIRDMYVTGLGEIETDDWDEKLHEGSIVTTTEKKRRKDGTEYWTEVIVTPFDFKGEKASLSINHDITNRKAGEENLTKALGKATESDRLKSAFLANMSHEIRTPMNGILGFSDLLKDPELTGDEQQEYIKIIEKSGRRMLNTINDIIDISRIEAGQIDVTLSEVNINDQIDYLHTFFRPEAENKNIKLLMKKGLSNGESIVKTDREKLYSILTNLVKNAIKYSHKGSIEFGYFLKKQGEFSELEFYVEDSGIGIPKDRQKAIFGRFIQADIEDKHVYEGSGLGLAISKAYVEMLGGKMSLISEENIGSKFCFTLPYNFQIKENTSNSNEKIADSTPKIKKLKILIADDETTAEIYLTLVLKKIKDEILFAKTGVEAVEIIRTNPDIDLILMDIRMPEMDGYEATTEIRKFNKKVVIIAQTAFGLIGDKERAINAGCDDYISKPIKKNDLVALVEKYFQLEG